VVRSIAVLSYKTRQSRGPSFQQEQEQIARKEREGRKKKTNQDVGFPLRTWRP
jgi:hypothetical protein